MQDVFLNAMQTIVFYWEFDDGDTAWNQFSRSLDIIEYCFNEVIERPESQLPPRVFEPQR